MFHSTFAKLVGTAGVILSVIALTVGGVLVWGSAAATTSAAGCGVSAASVHVGPNLLCPQWDCPCT
jgi:hypothetical protein